MTSSPSPRRKNAAALGGIVSMLVALALIPALCARYERPQAYADTYPQARGVGIAARVERVRPGLIPPTAREIHHLHDERSGATWVRFLFDPADTPRVTRGMRRLSPEETKDVEVRSPGAAVRWWLLSSRTLSGGQGRQVQVYEAPNGYLVVDPRSSTAYFWTKKKSNG